MLRAQSNDAAKTRGRARQQDQQLRLVAVPSSATRFVAVVFQTAAAAEDALPTVRELALRTRFPDRGTTPGRHQTTWSASAARARAA